MENSSIPVTTEVLDFSRLKELFGDDNATIQKLFDTFVTSTAPLLAELDKTIIATDFASTRALAHQLAGAAANLGAQRMHLIARELENASGEYLSNQCHTLYDELSVAFIEVCKVVSSTK